MRSPRLPVHRTRRTRRARRALGSLVGSVALVLVATTVTALPAEARQAPERGSAGIGDPYFPLDGNGGYDVTHYDVRDTYDQRSGRLRGATILRAGALVDLSQFSLDLLLPVRSVRVDGVRADFVKQGGHELVVTPRAPLVAGASFTVRVRYAGKPARQRYLGERNWLTDGVETVSMNEPHMAPWWFAANDHPLDKATFDIRITGASRDTVVSNGELVGRRPARRGAGLTTTHWRSTQPMAPYLAFFAMGPYDLRRGTSGGLRFYAAVARGIPQPQRRQSMKAMLASPAIVRWLSSVLGPYPFSSTGGLTTGLPVGFALENQTRPTYPVLGPGRRSTVVHELAHQWFGDSVSVAGWSDIWLNEGFASFMELLWVEQRGGTPAQTALVRAYDDRVGDAAFWRLRIGDPGPKRMFDDPVYTRGAMAVQALRHRIGETAFLTLLRTWLSTRQHGNGSIAEFEALAEQVSGAELTPFFDAWLRTSTPPARTADNGLV